MRIVGALAAVLLVACQVTVRADDDGGDAGDAGDASVVEDAGPDGCTGTEYVENCQRFWPGYSRGWAASCEVDGGEGCYTFDKSVTCCP